MLALVRKRVPELNLALMLAKRDIRYRYINSYAGILWNVGVPLLYALINVVVFSILMKGRMGLQYGDIPFALFYFVPFTLWAFFSDIVIRSTSILKEYGYLISKVAFPFWILPLVPIASALLNQFILLTIIGLLLIYHNIPLGNGIGYIILIWAINFWLTLGVAYVISALSLFVPDLSQIVPIAVNIMFWLTPILYPAALVEQHGALWVRGLIMDFNPFYYLVEMSRHAVFGSMEVSLLWLAVMGVISISVFYIGITVFHKLKHGFADVI